MTAITSIYENALLSEAAYANLSGTEGDQAELLRRLNVTNKQQYQGTLSATQAAEFANTWEVVHHQPDTPNGFSATLFKNIITGEYSYAIRGTADSYDLFVTDVADIVLDGLAMDQIVDMYNHWTMLATPQNQTYQQAELVTLTTETDGYRTAAANLPVQDPVTGAFIPAAQYLEELRARTDIVIDTPTGQVRQIQYAPVVKTTDIGMPAGSTLDVTGHSLGGHLASAFTQNRGQYILFLY